MKRHRSVAVSAGAYQRIAFAAVVALSAIIVTGGAVRLTDSGLGCPDWPTCAQHHFVAQWQYHQVVEFANRVFTGLVSAAVVLAVVGAALRVPRRRDLLVLSLGLVGGLIAQIVLGGLTVIYKLAPGLVMAHFTLSIAVLWVAVVLLKRSGQPDSAAVPTVRRELVLLSRTIVATLALVIVLGTAVTGSGPHSGSATAPRLAVSFRGMAELHASLVMLLVGLTIALQFALRLVQAPGSVRRRGAVLLALMAAQAAIGYIQYFTHVPVVLVGFHIAGATTLWIAAVWFHLGLFTRPEAATPFQRDHEEVIRLLTTA